MNDLRTPDADETPLSPAEVLQGIRDGTVASGPSACARAFAHVLVARQVQVWQINPPELRQIFERQRVEVVNLAECE